MKQPYSAVLIAETAAEGLLVLREDGGRTLSAVWCNRAFERESGMSLDELRAARLTPLDGAEAPAGRRVREAALQAREETEALRLVLSRLEASGDMEAHWLAVASDPCPPGASDAERAERVAAAVRTLAGHQADRQRLDCIGHLIENAQDLITITDLDFRVIWANDAFVRRSGYALGDVVGRSHCELLDKTGQSFTGPQAAIKALISGAYRQNETRNRARDGEIYYADTRITVQRDADGRPVRLLLIERDITETRALREKLRAERDDLERRVAERTAIIARQSDALAAALKRQQEVNEQQFEFVRMASHEIRTPMSIISLAARRARRALKAGDAVDHERRMQMIDEALARLGMLIDSTLQIARAEAGHFDCRPEPMDFAAFLRAAVHSASEGSESHAFVLDADGVDEAWIDGDAARLAHVFDNLFGNARKYSPAADRVDVALRREGDRLRVDVRDYGLGIGAEDLSKLFRRYFRAATATGIAGAGIGLSLAHDLVTAHGGSLSVRSVEGEGSTFTVDLPLRSSPQR
ncbi:sensor histidine kinase [Rubrimonas cliftonensis]|uniref:histidine kinase n=1 Tax=Rubrimonas cliftonensis TaxID=89524 RepID=A0A1H4EK09_9RHOB|nr:ATP-binding protein [Rubrimonas cliftonensis]SEA85018.1 PAS domain S-box-containing protein [Rubrimonas cliftonensis]